MNAKEDERCSASVLVFRDIYFVGTDLPDDDYTTLVPRAKSTSVNHRKMPIIVEDKESKWKNSFERLFFTRLIEVKMWNNKKGDDGRKTTIQAITSRRSTLDQDHFEQTRSAPPSPAAKHFMLARTSRTKTLTTPIENVRATDSTISIWLTFRISRTLNRLQVNIRPQ